MMKSIGLFGLCLMGLVACDRHEVVVVPHSQPQIVTVDDKISVVPDAVDGQSVDTIRKAGPDSVTIETSAVPSSAPGPFAFSFTWKFTGNAPTSWIVNSYEAPSSRDNDFKFLGYQELFSGDALKFSKPDATRKSRYKYVLIGRVDNEEPNPPVIGNIIFKTIYVDFRSAP